ncbi:sugar phosphate isomerase/epimerase [bacterium]|nr:sugar phosphate isomerase/epimerase [bacterium]
MYVACSTLCFTRLSLEDALRTIREMHFPRADLAVHAAGPHLTPAEVLSDPGRAAQRLKAANLPLAAFHVVVEAPAAEVAKAELRAVCRLARVMTVPIVTVPAADRGADLAAEARRLTDWVRVAEGEGVILTVETHGATVTADPAGAVELCRRVPGLGLTLDPSHYLNTPHGGLDFDVVFPHVRHVRLRDTGHAPDQFQVRVGQGEVEYGRILSQLDRGRYDRALTVDVRDIPDSPFPVEPEVRKLKYLLESLI